MPATDIWHITPWELVVRMVLAAVLGGIIGFEREWSNHAAGFRTHIQVCLGSASIMLLSIYGFSEFVDETNVRVDPARLSAQVISGIGFLGAGAILRNGNMIKGLTTAASIWVVAAIGLCVGAGFFIGAITCTVIVLVNLFLFNKWEKIWIKKRRFHEIQMVVSDEPGKLDLIISKLREYDVAVVNVKMLHGDSSGNEKSEQSDVALLLSVTAVQTDQCLRAMEEIISLNIAKSVEATIKRDVSAKLDISENKNETVSMP
ncbi:MgtC/SapB family protein [Paenibacillus chibensis]|uniref:MgtC/SapB family protein n=1 Tax=Paenibacillus chibensis TaxID=59846 RepID=A0ABU6PRW2_9BACL|nr:MgtC/SapB family protein [Paenibacillus chibensis]